MNKTIISYLVLFLLLGIIFAQAASNLEVSIHQAYKQVLAGEDIWFTIKLSGFEEGRKDVILDYWISDFNGNRLSEEKETVAVESRAEFVKSIDVPENLKQGVYTIDVKVTSAGGNEVTGKDSFEVVAEVTDHTAYYVLAAILFLIIAAYIAFQTKFLLLPKKIALKIKIKNIIKKKRKFF